MHCPSKPEVTPQVHTTWSLKIDALWISRWELPSLYHGFVTGNSVASIGIFTHSNGACVPYSCKGLWTFCTPMRQKCQAHGQIV